jgi:hypothetical protein
MHRLVLVIPAAGPASRSHEILHDFDIFVMNAPAAASRR